MEDFSEAQHWFNFQFAVLLASNEIDFHYYKPYFQNKGNRLLRHTAGYIRELQEQLLVFGIEFNKGSNEEF